VLTSVASQLVCGEPTARPTCSLSEFVSPSCSPPSKRSGFCLPAGAVNFKVAVVSILPALTGARIDPLSVLGALPLQLYSRTGPVCPSLSTQTSDLLVSADPPRTAPR
jgi:hypothetical protein